MSAHRTIRTAPFAAGARIAVPDTVHAARTHAFDTALATYDFGADVQVDHVSTRPTHEARTEDDGDRVYAVVIAQIGGRAYRAQFNVFFAPHTAQIVDQYEGDWDAIE